MTAAAEPRTSVDLVGPKGIRAREARYRAIDLAKRAINDGLNQWELAWYTDHGTEDEVDALVLALQRVHDDLSKLLPPGWRPPPSGFGTFGDRS